VRFYGGHDWGFSEHQLCVVDEAGTVLLNQKYPESRQGLGDLFEALQGFRRQGELVVCIEAIRGRIPERYHAEGLALCPVSPNALVPERNRYTTSRSKSDRQDALCLANLVRIDSARLDEVRPDSPETEIVRKLKAERDDLLSDRLRKRSKLEALLRQVFPASIGLFADLDGAISRSFLSDFPSWKDAESLTVRRLRAWLKKHRYSGRQSAESLLEACAEGAAGLVSDAELASCRRQVARMIDALDHVHGQIKEVEAELAEALKAHPDTALFKSFPMVADLTAAGLISLFGDDRSRFSKADGLAAISGVVPVTIASGKSHRVCFRRACNRSARQTLVTFAQLSKRQSEWAKKKYEQRREKGQRHPAATRAGARDWLRVIYSCWKNRTLYDPTLHRAAVRLLEEAKTAAAG